MEHDEEVKAMLEEERETRKVLQIQVAELKEQLRRARAKARRDSTPDVVRWNALKSVVDECINHDYLLSDPDIIGLVVLHKDSGIPIYLKCKGPSLDPTTLQEYLLHSKILCQKGRDRIQTHSWKNWKVTEISTENLCYAYVTRDDPSKRQSKEMNVFAELYSSLYEKKGVSEEDFLPSGVTIGLIGAHHVGVRTLADLIGTVMMNSYDIIINTVIPRSKYRGMVLPKLEGSQVILAVTDSTLESIFWVRKRIQSIRKWAPNAKLLGIANKQDQPSAISVDRVEEILGLPTYGVIAIDSSDSELIRALADRLYSETLRMCQLCGHWNPPNLITCEKCKGRFV